MSIVNPISWFIVALFAHPTQEPYNGANKQRADLVVLCRSSSVTVIGEPGVSISRGCSSLGLVFSVARAVVGPRSHDGPTPQKISYGLYQHKALSLT
jgi:hypothetical protein